MTATDTQVDPREVAKFDRLSGQWWDPLGPLRTLHVINPVRVDYIAERLELSAARVLDVGCGGGLLSEALARRGARVVGIDLAEHNIDVAVAHARQGNVDVEYRMAGIEAVSAAERGGFDAVCCLEVLEHVPSPATLIEACARALRPGGKLFLSTINRNPKSFALAIVAAEYLLGLVPRGSHEYRRLIRPSELARWCRQARLGLDDVTGLHYDPLTPSARTGGNVDVNYLATFSLPADE